MMFSLDSFGILDEDGKFKREGDCYCIFILHFNITAIDYLKVTNVIIFKFCRKLWSKLGTWAQFGILRQIIKWKLFLDQFWFISTVYQYLGFIMGKNSYAKYCQIMDILINVTIKLRPDTSFIGCSSKRRGLEDVKPVKNRQ